MGDKSTPLKIVRLVPVIETTVKTGTGTDNDPMRLVTQYWDLNGNLISEHDEQKEESANNH